MRRALALALLFAACGGGAPEPVDPPVTTLPPPDWSALADRAPAPQGAPDLLLVAIDGVERGWTGDAGDEAWGRLGTLLPPATDGFAHREPHFPGAGATPLVATLLTGLGATGHGLGAARDVGAHRLRADVPTLPAALRDVGYATVGAVALPQLRASLTGFDRGFDVYRDAGLDAALDVALPEVVVDRLVADLASVPDPVRPRFAFAVLTVPRFETGPLPPGAADAVRRTADEFGDDAIALGMVESGDVEGLRERFGRRRGSAARDALAGALQDAWLAEIVRQVDRALAALDSEPLAAAVELRPTRGEADRGGSEPCRVFGVPPRGRDGGVTDWVALDLLHEAGFGDLVGDGFAAPRERWFDATTPPYLDVHVEAGGDARVAVRVESPQLASAMRGTASDWHDSSGLGARSEVVRVELGSLAGGSRLGASTVGRAARVRLDITDAGGRPLDESRVLVGGAPLPEVLLPRLPDPRGEAWPEDDPRRVEVESIEGGWLRVTLHRLEGEAAPEVAARFSTWPALEMGERVPERAPTAEDERALGRWELRPGPGRRLAVAIAVDGVCVPAREMCVDGHRGETDALSIVLPGPDDPACAALFAPDAEPPAGMLRITRVGPPFPEWQDLSPADRALLRKLPAGE